MVALNDTQGINPKIANTDGAGNDDGILAGFGEPFNVDAVQVALKIAACCGDVVLSIGAPTIAQRTIVSSSALTLDKGDSATFAVPQVHNARGKLWTVDLVDDATGKSSSTCLVIIVAMPYP